MIELIQPKCKLCSMDSALQGFDFCSVDCARMFVFVAELKKIQGVLIEIKYELRS